MPQPAGQKLGTPFGQGEVKLKRFPLILGVIGWVLVICSFLFLGVVLSIPSRAVQISAPQRTLNVWAIVLNVSSLALGILGFVGFFFIAG